jgi:acyl-CoA synthetase (AMP-forming)/AMP-acid ligase II
MNYRKLSDQALAVAAAVEKADVRPDDRVLVMLPDGPGFIDAFAGVMQQVALPLPANPLLSARDIVTVAADAGARVVLVSADRIPALADLKADAPVFIDGPLGFWAAVLRLR